MPQNIVIVVISDEYHDGNDGDDDGYDDNDDGVDNNRICKCE